ncbi:class I lanthipeptide [Chitinophaga solisilvae]|uniref:Uncharacterized protein n=1 Tax=Chitinophaga solisilvae TaxID=1233460 RepID=A0A433WKQ8_9BACT|nr:class I lanthipeptide [Chitinophaga solisilvae]NSL90920.1 hypothetical protein [Chitinophaga solisilvae]
MKKKLSLGKKLTFSKTAVASLNVSAQILVAGGKLPITFSCGNTLYETCETQPSPMEVCRPCMG